MTNPLPIGRKTCMDCPAIPPPRMRRCPQCLAKRLDRLSKKDHK
jgi:hypothetical protein